MNTNPDQQSTQPLFGTDRLEKRPPLDNAVFDEKTFLDYVGNNIVLAHRVVRTFLGDLPGSVAEIGTALGAGDAPMAARAAHNLKGAVSFFAAAAALDAVCQIETLARAADLQRAGDAFTELGRETPRLTAALEAFLLDIPRTIGVEDTP